MVKEEEAGRYVSGAFRAKFRDLVREDEDEGEDDDDDDVLL